MARARSLTLAVAVLLFVAAAATPREAAAQDMDPRNKKGKTLELGPTSTTRRSLLQTSTDAVQICDELLNDYDHFSSFDSPFNDIGNFTVSTIDECAALCNANCSCIAFVPSVPLPSYCWIKDKIYPKNNWRLTPSRDIYMRKRRSSGKNLVPIVVPTAIAVGLISVAALLVFIWWLRRNKRASRASYKGMPRGTPSPRGMLSRAGKGVIQLPGGHLIQALTFEEVAAATSNFSDENKLGKGGYGTVYRGTAPDGSVWAFKRAQRVNDGEADAEFEDEVKLTAPMAHRNLVSLKGFCAEKGEQILIYEFVANGTLKQHLMLDPKLGGVPLSFSQRLEIAVGSARGLQYLHSFGNEPVIHRDIKSENILLDANLQAKVADFGLLKPLNEEATHVSTRVAGTIGYMDPEYRHLHRVSTKSDVYSFGVVLLELITGKKPVVMADRPTEIEQTVEHITLVQWVNLQAQAGNWTAIVDPLLKEDYPLEGAKRFIQLARLCTQLESRVRPSMQEVTRILEEIISGGAVDWEKDIGTIPNQRIPFPYQQGSGSIATTSSESFIPPLSQRPGIR